VERGVFAVVLLALPVAVLADAASQLAGASSAVRARQGSEIKRLRDAQITICKTEPHDDPGYCDRFWSDYGNGGRRAPRLFNDLPGCVAADQACKAFETDELIELQPPRSSARPPNGSLLGAPAPAVTFSDLPELAKRSGRTHNCPGPRPGELV